MNYITRIAAIGVAILGAAMAFDQPELCLLVAAIVVWIVSGECVAKVLKSDAHDHPGSEFNLTHLLASRSDGPHLIDNANETHKESTHD